MAIELGALALAIRDVGGDATLGKLRAIDAQAKATGARPVTVPISAPGAAQVVGQIGQVGTASKTALAGVTSLRGALGTALGSIAFAGAIGTIAGLGVALTDSARAYDEMEQANRRLTATSKITGAALADLEAVTRRGEQSFGLSRTGAAGLSIEITKLTAAAGQLDKSEQALRAFLDLGAARGLTATQTLTALRQSILGIDEGTDKLFNRNPSALWKEYAASIGTTAGKLTDAQKQQALLSAALLEGAKVGGEYERFLGTAAGKSEQLAVAIEKVKIGLGEMFRGARDGVSGGGASLLSWIADGISAFNRFDAAGEKFWSNLVRRLRGLPADTGQRFVPQGPSNVRPTITITGERETAEERRAREEALRKERERIALISAQVRALEELVDLRKLEVGDLDTIQNLERELTAELERGNLSLMRRVEITQELLTLQGLLGKRPDLQQTPSREAAKPRTQPGRINVPEHIQQQLAEGGLKFPPELLDEIKRQMDLEEQVAKAIGDSIANGIASGFALGLAQGGIAEGFKQMAAQTIASLGSLAIELGLRSIAIAKFMAGIAKFLVANPLLAIGLGVGLVALGASMGGRRGASGAGRGPITSAGFGGNDTTRIQVAAGGLPPNRMQLPGQGQRVGQPMNAVTLNVGLLNPNDPSSQRLLATAIGNAQRRGY